MGYNTFRSKDMEAERELAKFLDKHLYTNNIFTRSDRTDDSVTQVASSDIIPSVPSLGIKDAVVDEKASIYYINKDLRTLAQEMRATHKTMIAPPDKPYRFYFTQKLAEKPVNILLNKEEYIRLSEFHYFVRPNGDI